MVRVTTTTKRASDLFCSREEMSNCAWLSFVQEVSAGVFLGVCAGPGVGVRASSLLNLIGLVLAGA